MDKKICVYAIAKNEIKFINRWYNSIKEADYICVLDTGSTDGSFEEFKKLNIITKQITYKNFRFDTARNDSLKLIPNDAEICVCVDIDEEFELGWSKLLKEKWSTNTTRARYRYTWNFNTDGSEGVVFMADKIHKNKMYNWIYPVHEVLNNTSTEKENIINISEIQLNHRADIHKSRKNYLPLLELSVKENPYNDRNLHYLGREYMFNAEYDKAIEVLNKHLSLPNSTWNEERCASLRYIAVCYKQKNEIDLQEKYLQLAILECNTIREPYYELGKLYFEKKDYLKSCVIFAEMLKITDRQISYMSSPVCWSSLPYDYLSICYYHLGDIKKALENINKAINLNQDSRLKENKKILLNMLKH